MNKLIRKIVFQAGAFLALAVFPLLGHAQSAEQVLPRYIIQGRFFTNQMPLDALSRQLNVITFVQDEEGHRAVMFQTDAAFSIPESLLAYEIPKAKVKNADQFLESARLLNAMQEATRLKETDATIAEGGRLPDDFKLTDLDGNTWSKASMAGKVTVINVWYSGCGPCLKEMPILSEWKNTRPDALFLSANFEKAEKVKQVTDKHGFNWTHLTNDTYFTKWVGNEGYPLTIILDADGIIRNIVHGTNDDKRAQLLTAIDRLLNN